MWVIKGPFDGDEGQELSVEKPKLLKPGRRYVLGRRDADLLIPSKKVSREHVTLNISEFPTSCVGDPTFKPDARLQNPRNKPIIIRRGANEIILNPSSSTELCSGDAIQLIGDIIVVISWHPLCCNSPATFVVDRESCAIIGIHVVHSPCPEVTHSVARELTLTPSCVFPLLTSKVVTPEWLTEVIRRGTEGGRISSLEQRFELPDSSSYFPTISTTLPSTLSSTDLRTINSNHREIFDDHWFIILTRDSEYVEDFQSVISLSGGGCELFLVGSGKVRLRRRLSADKDGKRKIVVVDDKVKASVASDSWNELIDEAKVFGSTLCNRELILEAILVGEPSIICPRKASKVDEGTSSELCHEDSPQRYAEDSLRLKRLTRRTTPSTHPSIDRERSSEVEQPQVRRALTRRVKAGSVPPVADDSGTPDPNHCVKGDSTPPIGIDMNIPLLPRSSRPLKRRAGTAAPESALQPIDELETQSVEPPLKRFKALFEESDPDRLPPRFLSKSLNTIQESHPQSSSMVTNNSPGQEEHLHVFEGDEASQRHTIVEPRGTKRRATAEDMESDPLFSTSMEQENAARPLKRRMTEGASGGVTKANPPQSQTQGAKIGEPDTDKRFLTALATMRRGKRSEDSFDREFNDLRISKPDLEQEATQQGWDLLEGLDDEHNVRGNFMLVVELEVHDKDGTTGMGALRTGRIDWEGKPDFKKFRKKSDFRRQPVVELVVNQGNDYGVGPAYWKDDPGQVDEFLGHSQTSKTRAPQPPIEEDTDDDDQSPVKSPSKTSTRTTGEKNHGSGRGISEPLFLSSEDEEDGATKHYEDDDRDEGTETLRSAGSSRKSRTKRVRTQRMVVVVDNDSDDGTTFKGFGSDLKPTRR